mgnify:CR=1 FL=1
MNEENKPLLNIQDLFEFIEKSRAHIPTPYELAFGIKQAEHVLNEVFKDNGDRKSVV